MNSWNGAAMTIAAALLAAACRCSGVAAQQQPNPAYPCGAEETAHGIVKSVTDGRTFTLDDGGEVRLAAIEVPQVALPPQATSAPGGAAARDALVALAAGDEVVLHRAETAADRYGRIVAYAYIERDGDEIFVQDEMLAAGFARVGDRVGSRACAKELLNREQGARRAKLGLWAIPYYEVLNAETPSEILAHRGRFALVEGKVVSVRDSGATTYVNFGRRWPEEFTVTVLKRNERNFTAAGLEVKGLAGRRVRIRGWIEERSRTAGGMSERSPFVEAERPEQIETLDRD